MEAFGVDCNVDWTEQCTSCHEGYFLNSAKVCQLHTSCDVVGKQVKSPGTGTKDTECGALKQCTCTNGAGATGTLCAIDDTEQCESRDTGYYLVGGVCQKHTSCSTTTVAVAGSGTQDNQCA